METELTHLSIVVPVFNGSEFIERLLDSIPRRPWIEVLLVDDGSTDNSVEICELWDSVPIRKQVICLDHVGPGAARQVGLEAACGQYVTFADADDEFVSEQLEQMVSIARVNDLDVLIGGYRQVRVDMKTTRDQSGPSAKVRRVRPSKILTERAAIWGKLYRRAFLKSHAISFTPIRSADDVIFSWEVASVSPKTAALNDVCYLYFVDPHGQLTRDPRYFEEGVESMGILLRQACKRSLNAKLLAIYAAGTGLMHIVKRSHPAGRFRLVRTIPRGLLGTNSRHLVKPLDANHKAI